MIPAGTACTVCAFTCTVQSGLPSVKSTQEVLCNKCSLPKLQCLRKYFSLFLLLHGLVFHFKVPSEGFFSAYISIIIVVFLVWIIEIVPSPRFKKLGAKLSLGLIYALSFRIQAASYFPQSWVLKTELGTFEWWISGLRLNPLFFLISLLT